MTDGTVLLEHLPTVPQEWVREARKTGSSVIWREVHEDSGFTVREVIESLLVQAVHLEDEPGEVRLVHVYNDEADADQLYVYVPSEDEVDPAKVKEAMEA